MDTTQERAIDAMVDQIDAVRDVVEMSMMLSGFNLGRARRDVCLDAAIERMRERLEREASRLGIPTS